MVARLPVAGSAGAGREARNSIIGLAVSDRSALRVEAIGRCWSQGHFLAWLGQTPSPVSSRCFFRRFETLSRTGSGTSGTAR